MPDITFPNSQTDGSPALAAEVAENLYTPRVSPDTLAVVNGFLDKDNLDASLFPLDRSLVRPGAYGKGAMVGATANQDFFSDWYDSYATPLDDMNDSGLTIPGGALTYKLDFDVTLLIITWQLGIIVDGPDAPAGVPPFDLPPAADPGTWATVRLFLDGTPVPQLTQGLQGSQYTLHDRQKVKYQYPNRSTHADHRWWTGKATFYLGDDLDSSLPAGVARPVAAGFHTAELRVASKANVARCKTRNMSYRYLR